MTKTMVVNLRHESYDVYIGRPSKWGNPHRLCGICRACGKTHQRGEAVVVFREEFRARIDQEPELRKELEELRGKRLGCFCKPLACHGDVYVELLEKNNGMG